MRTAWFRLRSRPSKKSWRISRALPTTPEEDDSAREGGREGGKEGRREGGDGMEWDGMGWDGGGCFIYEVWEG